MDKGVYDRQINKKHLIPQAPSSDNHSNYKISQSVVKMKDKENNENNIIDYKNISLTMTGKLLSQYLKFALFLLSRFCGTWFFFVTGEISSDYIHRNSLTEKQPNITFTEDMEDDDEQFILNMKTIIDKNYET